MVGSSGPEGAGPGRASVAARVFGEASVRDAILGLAKPGMMVPSRKPIVVGNWKMNLTHVEAGDWLEAFVGSNHDWLGRLGRDEAAATDVDIAVLPSYTSLLRISEMAAERGLKLEVGAQSVSTPKAGAFTGDVSAQMLRALGCRYVLIGHSEQRRYHPEDDGDIAERIGVVLGNEMTPILCIGETRLGREQGIGIDYALDQLASAVVRLGAEDMARVIVAYEPVWSIGTGRTPDLRTIESAARDIRDFIAATFDGGTAGRTRLLYGGSVAPGNAAGIIRLPDVDGFLVGGASLDPVSFAKIWHRTAESCLTKSGDAGRRGEWSLPPCDGLDGRDEAMGRYVAEHHADTAAWRAQLALAAYRLHGFGGVLGMESARIWEGVDSSGAAPPDRSVGRDQLRSIIHANRVPITLGILRLISACRVNGVVSTGQWLVTQDDSLTDDERCERLIREYALAACERMYDEYTGGVPHDEYIRITMNAYLACDRDSRIRHYRRRGMDSKLLSEAF